MLGIVSETSNEPSASARTLVSSRLRMPEPPMILTRELGVKPEPVPVATLPTRIRVGETLNWGALRNAGATACVGEGGG